MIRHQRRPGIGPLAGWRGADGSAEGRGAPNPAPGRALHRERRLLDRARPGGGRLLQALERRLPGLGGADGLLRRPRALPLRALLRAARPLPGRRARHRRRTSRPSTCATGSPARWRRCRSGIRPTRTTARPPRTSRSTRSASARRRCTTPGARRTPGCGRSTARTRSTSPARSGRRSASRTATGPSVISPHARITVPVARMDALNPWTVWTWNAIGKRAGAWALVARRARRRPAASCSTT